MILPRVVVDVMPTARGWTVRSAGSAPYDMDARVLGDRRIPCVPAGRRPSSGAHALLCAGDEAELAGLLDRLATAQADAADVVAYGRWLYECMLAPSWTGIRARADVAAAGGVELALRWPADDIDLHSLAWEAMHSGRTALAGDPGLLVAITRVVPADVPPPVRTGSELRLLLAAGAPLTDDRIRAGTQFMGLLRGLELAGPCTVRVAPSLTVRELTGVCARFRPHIVHLVAPGGLEDNRHAVRLTSDRDDGVVAIRALLPALTHGHRPAAVVLSVCAEDGSCDNAATVPLAAELATGGIAVVVAMAGEISEPACRLYTQQLIRAVSAGEPVAAATAQGRWAALRHLGAAPSHLDWARPALFLADSVPSSLQIVDPAPRQRLRTVGQELNLSRQPLFVGQADVLAAADRLVTTERDSPGFFGIIREGPAYALGGTRLLPEIALQLLARGHLPLLLGPYGLGGTPASGRELVADILAGAGRLGSALGLVPAPSRVLGDQDPAVTDWQARASSIAAFRRRTGEWDPESEQDALIADLDQLASAAGAAGPPFGPHSRPVILGDDVHDWTTSLNVLLAMVGPGGLGPPVAPIPVVVTASLHAGTGPMLRAFVERNSGRRSFAIRTLEPIPPAELAISYQWLLLHPWRPGDPVYTPARGASPAELRRAFALLADSPAAFSGDLYLLARLMASSGLLVAADDESLLAAVYSEDLLVGIGSPE